MLKKNSETFFGCDVRYEDADIVLFGAPFDSTTSFRPGSRFACKAMRGDSYGLENYSPYQDRDLADSRIMDAGDLELCIGDSRRALDQIRDFVEPVTADGKIPFMIGGEHLVTLGSFEAVLKKHPDICLVHLDAHADLREEYLGATLSHASVIRRCWDLIGDGRIWQFGVRSGEKREFEWAKNHTRLQKFHLGGLENCAEEIAGRPVYLTLDLDILDPSVFPGTGTPEPGGISFSELMRATVELVSSLRVVACDMDELSPVYDQSGASTAAACKMLREMLLAVSQPGTDTRET